MAVYNTNTKVDKFISKTEIKILMKGDVPKDPQDYILYYEGYLHYNAELYKTAEGEKYYLFKSFDDCNLYINNCNKNIYDTLEKIIELNDDIMIFETDADCDDDDNLLVSPSYRKINNGEGLKIVIL